MERRSSEREARVNFANPFLAQFSESVGESADDACLFEVFAKLVFLHLHDGANLVTLLACHLHAFVGTNHYVSIAQIGFLFIEEGIEIVSVLTLHGGTASQRTLTGLSVAATETAEENAVYGSIFQIGIHEILFFGVHIDLHKIGTLHAGAGGGDVIFNGFVIVRPNRLETTNGQKKGEEKFKFHVGKDLMIRFFLNTI